MIVKRRANGRCPIVIWQLFILSTETADTPRLVRRPSCAFFSGLMKGVVQSLRIKNPPQLKRLRGIRVGKKKPVGR